MPPYRLPTPFEVTVEYAYSEPADGIRAVLAAGVHECERSGHGAARRVGRLVRHRSDPLHDRRQRSLRNERNRRQLYVLSPIPLGDVENRVVGAGRHTLIKLEQSFCRRGAASDALALMKQLQPHSGTNDSTRNIDYMDGNPRHENVVCPCFWL